MKTVVTVAASLAALLGTAAAQEAYVSGGIGVDEDFEEFGFGARLGYDVKQNIGIEGEATFFGEDIDGTDVDITVFGAFAKAGLPVGEMVSVHARVGYAGVNIDVEDFGDDTEGGLGLGIGSEVRFTPQAGVRIDYTRLETDSFEGGFVSAHFVYRFGGTAQ